MPDKGDSATKKILIPIAAVGALIACILAAWFLAYMPLMKKLQGDFVPRARAEPEPLPPHDILIHVDADDTVSVNGEDVEDVADIPEMLAGNPKGKDAVVLIRINALAPPGRHAQIYGAMSRAGYAHICAQKYLGDEVLEIKVPRWFGVGSSADDDEEENDR